MAIDLIIKNFQGGNPTMKVVSEEIGDTNFIKLLSLECADVYEGLVQIEVIELDASAFVYIRVAGWPIWESDLSKVYFAFKDPSTNILNRQEHILNSITPGNGYFIPVFFSSSCRKLLVEIEVAGPGCIPFPPGTCAVIRVGAGVNSSR